MKRKTQMKRIVTTSTRRVMAIAIVMIVVTNVAHAECRPFVGTYGGVSLVGQGYAKYLPTSATRLSDTPTEGVAIHRLASGATITVTGASIRFRTDGTNPTATSGEEIAAGSVLKWTAPEDAALLREFRFIQKSSGAEVTISYCW